MSKSFAFPALAAGAALALIGGGVAARSLPGSERNPLDNGEPITAEWRSPEAFGALTAVGPDTVQFETGPTRRIRAQGDPRVLERLRFAVRDGKLIVGRRSDSGRIALPPAVITVVGPAIHGATAAGSGRVSIARLTGDDVFATVAGSGALGVHALDARAFAGTVAGSGNLVLAGRSRSAALAIAGSGRLEGRGFTAGTASTTVAGSGDAAFRSPGPVKVSITGSGSVWVSGGATCTLVKIGSGTLRCG